MCDRGNALARCRFEAVIHFAGLKAVGESVAKPLLYYDNNLIHSCCNLAFSVAPCVFCCCNLVMNSSVLISAAGLLLIVSHCLRVAQGGALHGGVPALCHFFCMMIKVRDYIHVVDLADGHIAALPLRKLYEDSDRIGCQVYTPLFRC
uniref:Uncharacterized protein n=1 Tax=Avena sativa TaxID=4498 RepID=A0ACD5TCV6_AVESA